MEILVFINNLILIKCFTWSYAKVPFSQQKPETWGKLRKEWQ